MSLGPEHLPLLQSEAVHVLREVAAQCERPALLFSGGKDSIVVTWLARKAFAPARVPFPLLHIDTGHNFPETLSFRDRFAKETGCTLLVRLVQESIDQGRVADETGPETSRNALQTVTLLHAIKELGLDAAYASVPEVKAEDFTDLVCLGFIDDKGPIVGSVANGHEATHPESFLLGCRDLVADALASDLALELGKR